eukprot:SAG11_NODE_2823_length_2938_cov_2.731243_2_plen_39_part_00
MLGATIMGVMGGGRGLIGRPQSWIGLELKLLATLKVAE